MFSQIKLIPFIYLICSSLLRFLAVSQSSWSAQYSNNMTQSVRNPPKNIICAKTLENIVVIIRSEFPIIEQIVLTSHLHYELLFLLSSSFVSLPYFLNRLWQTFLLNVSTSKRTVSNKVNFLQSHLYKCDIKSGTYHAICVKFLLKLIFIWLSLKLSQLRSIALL